MRNLSCLRAPMLSALLALAVLAVACGNDDNGDDNGASPAATRPATGPAAGEALDTVSKGKLTACTDVPYAPFEFEQDGAFDGIAVELVRALSGRLALTAEFVDVDFDGIFSALNAGKCDIVASSVTITDERRKSLEFSDGYFEINQSLLVREADAAKYDDLPALAGKTIGVQSETTGADYARANATGATVKEFTGADDLFSALKAGQVEAVLQDLPVNAYRAKTAGDSVVTKVFTEGDKEEYGLAMRKGRTDLKAAIDGALAAVKADDTYPTILRRFLGDAAGQS